MFLLVPSSLILYGDHMCQLVQRHHILLLAPLGSGSVNGWLLLVVVIEMSSRVLNAHEAMLRLFAR